MKEIAPKIQAPVATPIPAADRRRPDPAALREKCQEFEAVFIEAMFKSMRSAVPESGLLPKGMGAEIFEEMRDAQTARQMAGGQGVGLGEALFRQLQKGEAATGSAVKKEK